MKAKKASKSTRASKATKDLSLAGRGVSSKVKGGTKVQNNMAEKERIRKAQATLSAM